MGTKVCNSLGFGCIRFGQVLSGRWFLADQWREFWVSMLGLNFVGLGTFAWLRMGCTRLAQLRPVHRVFMEKSVKNHNCPGVLKFCETFALDRIGLDLARLSPNQVGTVRRPFISAFEHPLALPSLVPASLGLVPPCPVFYFPPTL